MNVLDIFYNLFWCNCRSLKGKFGQRTPTVTFVRAKRRDLNHRKPTKTGLEEASYQKVEGGLQEVKKVCILLF